MFEILYNVCIFCILFRDTYSQLSVSTELKADYFPLFTSNISAATVIFSSSDFSVVTIAAQELAADIERVTGHQPRVSNTTVNINSTAVIIGTIGSKNTFIDQLVTNGKLDVSNVKGKFETFIIKRVSEPFAGISDALVIAGSDRRGAAFGVFELSQAIGVSPWYWWADVAVERKSQIYVSPSAQVFGPPSVKYRGIFINDEDWGIHPWAAKTFDTQLGDIGPKTYTKVFELLLRLKANTLWPAMHACNKAFNHFPEDKVVADEYGIIMSSSHAEPMLRNNVMEWTANSSAYNYITNRDGVYQYWEERATANGKYENIYTLGMRGIHDSAIVGPTTDAERIKTLEQIFADQREILAKHVNADVEKVPQQFCPYKEVLGYYRAGLKVPNDVTIVWPDDNFGYVRQFANASERNRTGGFGIYYHISYLGAPLSYLWLYTTPPALIWEEMTKAYDYGAKQIWILNVGDIKPGEYGTEFFLQHAWNISKWRKDNIDNYLTEVVARDFGSGNSKEIGSILKSYFELNYQRKPEWLQWWHASQTARPSPYTREEMNSRLQKFSNLRTRVAAVKSKIQTSQHDSFFELVEYPVVGSALANDRYFLGEESAFMSAAGNTSAHDSLVTKAEAADTELKNLTQYYNEVNAKGKWNRMMSLEPAPSFVSNGMRAETWKPPSYVTTGKVRVEDANSGVIVVEAEHFVSSVNGSHSRVWQVIPGLGRSGDSVAVFPTLSDFVNTSNAKIDSPKLNYNLHFNATGNFTTYAYLVPTHPIVDSRALRFAIGLNDEQPHDVSLDYKDGSNDWSNAVLNSTLIAKTKLNVTTVGNHTLVIYGTDPGVCIDKLVFDLGGFKESYLGPH